MDLATIWFVLIAVLWSGYFLLEGFDFGVGMLLPVLPRDEAERSTMFESIGPVWDGNEVWLVIAGGATFAAFPAWYATMFSGFYLALLLILVLLIVRVVSFEWRERSDSPRWRATWPWANTVGSVGRRRSCGASRSANLVHGVPLNSKGDFTGNVLDLFSAYTVLAGISVVALFAAPRRGLPDPAHERRAVRARRAAARRLAVPVDGRRHGLPGLDGRCRHRPQRPRRLPHGAARGDRRRSRSSPPSRSCRAPQRLGLRRLRGRPRWPGWRRCSPACIRACSSRTRTSPTA